ncbi:MAG: phosphatidylserine/phosphatidylglycerophosphate/cardiolipin synthase family protein [Puniceicoccaceae bacterium]
MKRTHPYDPIQWTSLFLIILLVAVLGGCRSPADVAPPPNPGPAPDIQRDKRLSGDNPQASRILDSAAEEAGSHRIILLESGDDALLARIHLIRSARESIDIQTFIWVYDRSGQWVYRELLEAARRGVKVRLLIDQFINPELPAEEYAAIATAHENLEIRLFRPLTVNAINRQWDVTRRTFTRFATMNHRMHHKVFLVDGQAAILGGRNYQDAYFDRDSTLSFRDRDVLVMGPACDDISRFFELFWQHEMSFEASRMKDLKKALETDAARLPDSLEAPLDPIFHEDDLLANLYDLRAIRPTFKEWVVGKIEYISDKPIKVTQYSNPGFLNPFASLRNFIAEADTEVLIQTPYSVFEDRTYKRWRKIRKQRPEVRVCLSTNSLSSADHVYVGSMALKQRRAQIESLGIELYLAKPVPGDIREMVPRYETLLHESASSLDPDWEEDPEIMQLDIEGPRFCIHAKTMIFDRKISFIGSHNFDPRSMNLNTECGVVIRDVAFSRYLAEFYDRAIHPDNSWVVAPRDFAPIVGEVNSFIGLVSTSLPLFDIWPLEHVSCYEMLEGAEPLSPYDESFHESYEDVGPFPGLDLGLEPVKVRLLRAIGDPAVPLM